MALNRSPPSRPISQPRRRDAYLVVGIAFEEKDIDDGQLVDESVAFKLLPHAGADE